MRNFGKSQALHAGFAKAQEMLSLLWMQTYKIAGRDSGLIYDYHANF
jgi:hypothetical protein